MSKKKIIDNFRVLKAQNGRRIADFESVTDYHHKYVCDGCDLSPANVKIKIIRNPLTTSHLWLCKDCTDNFVAQIHHCVNLSITTKD